MCVSLYGFVLGFEGALRQQDTLLLLAAWGIPCSSLSFKRDSETEPSMLGQIKGRER